MSLILNIDTSSQNASICLAHDGVPMAVLENAEQKDHAAWLHPGIKELLLQADCNVQDIKAVAITAGPGSYTGLRVGMSAAKGLCYALNIPLITENTLRVMALAVKQSLDVRFNKQNILFCPMIDARRLEVFTALFNIELEEVMSSTALIVSNGTFLDHLENFEIVFSGNGSKKFKPFVSHHHAIFSDVTYSAIQLSMLSNKKWKRKEFEDVAYSEPLYLKEFYTVPKK